MYNDIIGKENQLVKIRGLKGYQPPGKDNLFQVVPKSKKRRKCKPGKAVKENKK